MPQLDKLSFFTQYFWLTIFFFISYFILINYFVHVIFSINRLYKHINSFWLKFNKNFNQKLFNDILLERYTNVNDPTLILNFNLKLLKFYFFFRFNK